ncbi:hypothetical protein BST97_08270 [Nonlabens spongiae]|uniref:SusC/RagA family TonB-linked outer membrane protein n=1 Tax=Nonlabens spongiae TaxID=331648 RepID=A0A1W6MKF8_9FLAO|nr:SusC/RagA family TonB-linked outer membrane protein [Nonlabens spongiae]ARN77996.1 hypothetical protein BST97_08270 [Nonlabens spongiae]
MKTKLNGILTLLLALVAQVAFAQQTVTGTVTGPDGGPILGATVLVKNSSVFASTDFDGKYTIQASPEDILVFSYTGYDTQEIIVGDQTTIDVSMKTSLDEVVVQAYRSTTTKRSIVASSVVTAKQLEDRPNASAIQRLQGQVAGLSVQTSTGQPGANSLIQIRGVSSINGNTEPLIVIDGIPVDEDVFRTINPLDIESTTVLKDAAGTAIYGNRGANGVIVITTKRADFDQDLTVRYTSQTGFTELLGADYNLFSAQDYLRFERENGVGAGANGFDNSGTPLTDAEIAAFSVSESWEDAFYRTGRNTLHNLNLSSGGKNLSQVTTIGYVEQEGALLASDLQRFTLRNNLNIKSEDERFTSQTSMQLGFSKNNSQTEPDNDRNNFIYFNSIFGANRGLPYFDPNNSQNLERWVDGLQAFYSPYVTLDNTRLNTNKEDEIKMVIGANNAYKITDHITARYNIGMDYTQENYLRVADPNSALARVHASFIGPDAVEGFQTESFFRDFRFNNTLSVGYENTFGADENGEGGHTFLANLYTEYVKGHFKSFNYSQTGLNPRTFSPGNGAGFVADVEDNDEFVPTVGASKASTGLFSYFGEIDYDYDNKFGVFAALRRDASSRFTGDNTWGTFWSVAGRWNVSEMDFMQDVSWVNNLKVRASYGTTGNERIAGTYYGALNNFRTLFNTGIGYGDNQTFFRSQLGNESLRWETIKTANLGIEFGLFENRLRSTIEVYDRKTEDLFFNIFVSTLVTPSGSIQANVGDLSNKGAELALNYDLFRSDQADGFNFTVNANINYNEFEVTKIDAEGGLIDNGSTVIQEGAQLNEYFVVPYLGVNPANGNLLFEDINGNPTENPTLEDRRLTGTDSQPDFQGGFGFNTSYKGFFLESQFVFMTGLERFDSNLASYYDINDLGQYQLSSDLERSWTPDNRITDMPAVNATNLSPGVTSDRFLINSNFVRWRFLQLGYNFDREMLEKTFLQNVRIYANGENLATFSNWLGFDPESTRQSELNRYPTPRTVSVGIDLTF